MNFDSFDLAHALYYLVLIIFLSLSLFARRELNFSKTVKYAGIWLIIALFLIIGYSFRHELGTVKNRVTGELSPASTQINEQNQIVIYRSKNGHFYINSEINGNFVRFMVDTGASDTSMGIKDAQRVGIKTTGISFNKRYQTANGVIYAATSYAKNLKIGNIVFKDMPISIARSDIKTPLLGVNALRQFTKYEVSQDKLILTP